jgi:uncharacterized protein YggE
MLFTQEHKQIASVLGIGVLALLIIFLIGLSLNTFKQVRYIGTGGDVPNTLTFSGNAEIQVSPDMAKVSFVVEEEAADVGDAQAVVSEKIDLILEDLDDMDIDEKDIRTEGHTTNPRYDWKDGERDLRGYVVRQSIEVTIRDIDEVSDVIAVLGSRGITNLSGPYFEIDDKETYERLARKRAIESAREKAEELAADLGVRLVRVVSFNESSNGGYPEPRFYGDMAMSLAVEESAPAPQIPIGENTITANITITYEIQ